MINSLFEALMNKGDAFCVNSESLESPPPMGYLVDLEDTTFMLGYDNLEVKAKLWVIAMSQDFNDRLYLCGHSNTEDGLMMSASVYFDAIEEAKKFAYENVNELRKVFSSEKA